MTETKSPPRVDSTLSKGLMILEALSRATGPKGVTELSRELDLTKSNTFRLLQTLSALGYVRHADDRLYSATMKTWQLGQEVVDNLNLPAIAAPQMQDLSRQTAETVYLAVPDGLSVIYVDKIESTQPIRSFTPKGGSAPIHCVGTGKALLAAMYDRMRAQVKEHLQRYTDQTITSIQKLDADMATTQKRGYAIDRGEYRDRIYSIGAAIRLPSGRAIAALGVSAPVVNLSEGQEDEIGDMVREAALKVSEGVAKA